MQQKSPPIKTQNGLSYKNLLAKFDIFVFLYNCLIDNILIKVIKKLWKKK